MLQHLKKIMLISKKKNNSFLYITQIYTKHIQSVYVD